MQHHPLDKYMKIYKGKEFLKPSENKVNKVIVFDIDETLGSFNELDILWKCLHPTQSIINSIENTPRSTFSLFNELLELYPEFIRYGIIQIVHYLYHKKLSGDCYKLYVYTNNQCQTNWVSLVLNYITYKVQQFYIAHTAILHNIVLFDQVIYAFKINNKRIEINRTTHSKTYRDFIHCTLLPRTTELCFIDNTYFPEMSNERVYYIQPMSYFHNLSIEEICGRLQSSPLCAAFLAKGVDDKMLRDSLSNQQKYPGLRNKIENFRMNVLVAQKLMYHIKEFFGFANGRNKTRKRRHTVSYRFTRKASFHFII